jgi:hypothetical protein
MNINKYDALKQGIFLEKLTDNNLLTELINKLHPVQSKFELIRFGGDNDGGYLLPNDLDQISCCFSPEVGDNSLFEMDLLERAKISSHLADFSVDSAPLYFKPKSFTKKYLGTINDDKYITLDSWVRGADDFKCSNDFLLQMDIEGGEYTSILGVTEELLKRFRIIIIEIHNIESWGQKDFFNLVVYPFFCKLLKYFYVVHNHPNNYTGIVNLGGVLAPRTFELTLIRKDRCSPLGFANHFPHPLDRPNAPKNDDLVLPNNWFRYTDATEKTKYVLCRPQGGLTDQLCQIGRCIKYSKAFNRVLIIDTNFSNFLGLKYDFSNYFSISDAQIYLNYNSHELDLKNKSSYPKIKDKDINTYSYYHNGGECFLDPQATIKLTFDFKKDYVEEVLIHQRTGDGPIEALFALSHLKLKEDLSREILRRYKIIGINYDAIHIRNTDVKTNFKSALKMTTLLHSDKIFVASDDSQTLRNFKSHLGERFISFSNISNEGANPLHINAISQNIDEVLKDAICDLFLLGLSNKLQIVKVDANQNKVYSGFSQLADLLNKNKAIINSLIGK